MEEVEKVMQQSSSNKTPGMDRIPAGMCKATGPVAPETFHNLLINIWKEDMPNDFKDATIVPFFKNKGSKADIVNYWSISLLSVAGNCGMILAHVLLNHLFTSISEENLPEAQCGFCPDHSTINMVSAIQWL